MNNVTTDALGTAKALKKKEEYEPILVQGFLANVIRKAQDDFEYFDNHKAYIAEGLSAIRYIRMDLYPDDSNKDLVEAKLDKIESCLLDYLYYLNLMESKKGHAI